MSPEQIERFWSKVEKTDTCWNWTAYCKPVGYGQMVIDGRTTSVHRISYELANGSIPKGLHVDHSCHNKGCVNPQHLRIVTNKQNHEHLTGANANSKTGVRGVSWDKSKGKWQAKVTHNTKQIHLGRFETIGEAEAVVTAKRLELFTHNDLDRAA